MKTNAILDIKECNSQSLLNRAKGGKPISRKLSLETTFKLMGDDVNESSAGNEIVKDRIVEWPENGRKKL